MTVRISEIVGFSEILEGPATAATPGKPTLAWCLLYQSLPSPAPGPVRLSVLRARRVHHASTGFAVPGDRPDRGVPRLRRGSNGFPRRRPDPVRGLPDPGRPVLRGQLPARGASAG